MDPSTEKPSGSPAPDAAPKSIPKPKPSEGNPAFRMMGLPRWRPRLPSRNWMIFISTVSAFTGAWYYDRRETKRIQKKWCDEVAALSQKPLPANQMPRRITIVLAPFPGDGLLHMREHFHEYVKPILVASGLDWDVIEGRKEGDIRAQVAERIREVRYKKGEKSATGDALAAEAPLDVNALREAQGIEMEGSDRPDGPLRGDLMIGRHAWKEYVRGLHEGWLGPLDPPKVEEPPKPEEPVKEAAVEVSQEPAISEPPSSPVSSITDITTKDESTEGAVAKSKEAEEKEKKDEEKEKEKVKKPKRKQPVPFIATADYAAAELSRNTPSELGPSAVVPFPHIMGFLKSGPRFYRFLHRRYLAEQTGREVAAVAFGHYRPFEQQHAVSELASDSDSPVATGVTVEDSDSSEQEQILKSEEPSWHKSYRKRGRKEDAPPRKEPESDDPDDWEPHEYTWTDPVVLDPRIAQRMRKFVYER